MKKLEDIMLLLYCVYNCIVIHRTMYNLHQLMYESQNVYEYAYVVLLVQGKKADTPSLVNCVKANLENRECCGFIDVKKEFSAILVRQRHSCVLQCNSRTRLF